MITRVNQDTTKDVAANRRQHPDPRNGHCSGNAYTDLDQRSEGGAHNNESNVRADIPRKPGPPRTVRDTKAFTPACMRAISARSPSIPGPAMVLIIGDI